MQELGLQKAMETVKFGRAKQGFVKKRREGVCGGGRHPAAHSLIWRLCPAQLCTGLSLVMQFISYVVRNLRLLGIFTQFKAPNNLV